MAEAGLRQGEDRRRDGVKSPVGASRVGPRFVPLFDQRSPRNKACLPDWPQTLGRSTLRD
jgi:hypothetical protein